jgi:hypothetical protein
MSTPDAYVRHCLCRATSSKEHLRPVISTFIYVKSPPSCGQQLKASTPSRQDKADESLGRGKERDSGQEGTGKEEKQGAQAVQQ